MYERARDRMRLHPEFAEKYEKIIQDFPHFSNEADAVNAARELEQQNHSWCQVWAKIGKDEEYFYIKDYFIATDNTFVLQAAEYIGMAQIFTT